MLDRNSTTSEFLHALFQQHQLDLVPEIELSSNDLLLDLADIGLGIAFVPDFCLARAGGDLFQIPLKATLPTRQLALAYSDKMPDQQRSQTVYSIFQPEFLKLSCQRIHLTISVLFPFSREQPLI